MTFVVQPQRGLRRRGAGDNRRQDAGARRIGYYHFYLFSTEGKGHCAASMHCHDDIDAIEKAPFELQQSAGYPMIEIWHGRRLVERIGAYLAA